MAILGTENTGESTRIMRPGPTVIVKGNRDWYMLIAPASREPYSYQGAVLIHDNPRELEWLFPGVRVAKLPGRGLGRPLLRLRHHPDMHAVEFPLSEGDFR